MEVVTGFAACIGIATFAKRVAKNFQDLLDDLYSAEKRFQLLRIQVSSFSSAINNIVEAAQTSGAPDTMLDQFARELLDAAHGGKIILEELDLENWRSSRKCTNPFAKRESHF
jgi:hypothetical protein